MGDTETEDVKVIPLDNLGEELQEKPVEPSPEPCFIWTQTYWILFTANFLSAWGDRMWNFAVPLVMGRMFASLLPSSLFATVTQIACVAFGGYIGRWIDTMNRMKLQQTALLVQNSCVVVSFVFVAVMVKHYMAESYIVPPWGDPLFVFIFGCAVFFAAVAALASMITSVAISKDWIVVVQKANSYMPLPKVNATFRRIDLLCKLVAPIFFALIMEFAGLLPSLIIVTCWNGVSLIPESILWQTLYRRVPDLAKPKENVREAAPNPFSQIVEGWRLYFAQPIFRSSIAYVLLYMTVLSPGGVMTTYLESKHLKEIIVALANGLGALVGLSATFVAPILIEKFSLRRVGAYALWSQLAMLLLTLIPFLVQTNNEYIIAVLPMAVALSRFGLWSFDLVETQLMQTYVADDVRGVVSGVEYAMTNLISVLAYAMGLVVPDPAHFFYLVIVSLSFVGLAMLTYTFWYLHPPRGIIHIELKLAAGGKVEAKHDLDLPVEEDPAPSPSEPAPAQPSPNGTTTS